MPININISVTPRVQVSPDSQDRYLVTPDMFNDAARPIVTGSIDESALYPEAQITVGAKVTQSIPVTIQMRLNNENWSQRCAVFMWLTQDASTLTPSASQPDSSTPITFVSSQARGYTSASGAMSLTFTNAAAATWYLCIDFGGRVYVSEAMEF